LPRAAWPGVDFRGCVMNGGQGGSGERRVSRASVVKLGAAGWAGVAGASVMAGSPAEAAAGDPVIAGQTTDAGYATTTLTVEQVNVGGTHDPADGLLVTRDSGGQSYAAAVHGKALFAGPGIIGDAVDAIRTQSAGVVGRNPGGTGMFGSAAGVSDPTGFGAVGVHGEAHESTLGAGVVGESSGGAYGVWGSANNTTAAVYGANSGTGAAVLAENDGGGNGVLATTTSALADDTAAVSATNNGAGFGVNASTNGGVAVQGRDLSASSSSYGVYGQSANGIGVFGDSDNGQGVYGNTFDGTAVTAVGAAGTALDVQGVAKFSRSGIKTIAGTSLSPKSTAKVTSVALTANSIVLVTIQTNNAPGVFIQSAVPNVPGSYITINLNQAV
jgi:hypothetical protein